MIAPFNSILSSQIRVKIVDVGANPVDGDEPYAPILKRGEAEVVGFEPAPEALAELNKRKGPLETYLPHALGDGGQHTLYVCKASGMTSLFRPNMKVLGLLHGFSEWATVLKTIPVKTIRLDDVPEAIGCDLLKLDVQGAELLVLENGEQILKQCVMVQTEVEFMPFYEGQPLFGDVDRFLRKHGFVLHRFSDLKSRVLKPLVLNNDVYAGLSQIFWTDALYVKDFTNLDSYTTSQLLRLALLLNDAYQSLDLVLFLLLEYDKRAGTNYGVRYQKDGLFAKPPVQ